jgi:hypothetical protein
VADQQALPITVERVAKRSTSRVVRRPERDGEALLRDVAQALDRAGVKPGESFYVARVPPRDRTSHLGDLTGPPGSRAAQRRTILEFAACHPRRGMTAGFLAELAEVPGGWRRVSELVQGGHLEPTGDTVESTPGHPARLLRITDRGRAALRATDG